MRHSVGLVVLLALLLVSTAVEENDAGDVHVSDEDAFYSSQERRAHERIKAVAWYPKESAQHQHALDKVEADLLELYDEGRGTLTERSLLLLGDLAQRKSSEADLEDEKLGVVHREASLNQAGIYFEDAFEKHNSTEAYYRLGKVVESLGMMHDTVGNESAKEDLLDQANKMFLVCGAKGHLEALKSLVANCEKHLGFGPEGCPHTVQTQARYLNEELLKDSPNDPFILGKLAIFWAQGIGMSSADLPKACEFAERAAKANAQILASAVGQGDTSKMKDADYDVIGYNSNNYVLHGNCKYFSNFSGTGNALDRAAGRDILQHGLKMRHLRGDVFKQLEEHLESMIGPEEEPTYSGRIEWRNARHDELGDTWFVYIWVSLNKGFFWSSRQRLGDLSLKVTHKAGDGLVDFSGDDPPFWLEAEKFLAPDAHNLGQLHGKARRQAAADSIVEGNFTLTLVPQAPRAEL